MLDFELTVRPAVDGGYTAFARLSGGSGRAELAGNARVALDEAALRAASLDADEYGRVLGSALFADEALRAAWHEVRGRTGGGELRVRLRLEQGAAALHGLRWETLRAPDGTRLGLSERMRFSRYSDVAALPPPALAGPAALRPAVLVAHPDDLAGHLLASFDAARVTRVTTAALDGLNPTVWSRQLNHRGATLAALREALRGGVGLVCVVCHSRLSGGEPYFWLEDEGGLAAPAAARELAEAIREVGRPPALVVLMACNGAGDGVGLESLGGAGPTLLEAGVGAVLAMQGPVLVAQAERFLPELFGELQRDGVVDRAVAAARATLADSGGWWVPALFMRLADGRLWGEGIGAATSSERTLGAGERGRLELRRATLQQQYELALEVTAALETDLQLENHPVRRLQLRKDLESRQAKLAETEAELAELERRLEGR